MPFHGLPGISLNVSGILIFPYDDSCGTSTLSSGPKPRTPSCMQRSFLLSIDFKVSSLTDWAAQLKINPLYAILSGFEFGDTPGVGTFYDFLNRLWDSDSDNLSPHIHPLKAKVKKPKRKAPRLLLWKKSLSNSFCRNLKTPFFALSISPMALSFSYIRASSSTSPSPKGSLLLTPLH